MPEPFTLLSGASSTVPIICDVILKTATREVDGLVLMFGKVVGYEAFYVKGNLQLQSAWGAWSSYGLGTASSDDVVSDVKGL